MAKKLNNNELNNVNGGVVQPIVQAVVTNKYKCSSCGEEFSTNNLHPQCPKCQCTILIPIVK